MTLTRLAALLLFIGSSHAAEPTTVDGVAQELLNAINAKEAGPLVARFSGPMRNALPLEKAGPWLVSVRDLKGKILSLAREPGGNDRGAAFRFKAEKGEWRVQLQLDGEGRILGLRVNDPPPPDPPVAKSTLPLGLPFRGQWMVFWGGDTLEVNQHLPHKSQRRAADLMMVDATGKTFRGDGKKNQDYLAWGQEILAVADGTVITAIDGVPENAPGAMNPYFALGNAVIIKHDERLYSAYAHLQPGKLRVKAGDLVKRGAVLGLCGNSGNTSETHLHFQLQDGPLFESSWGVEPVFHEVSLSRAGKTSRPRDYTWLKGDLVSGADGLAPGERAHH
jgi:hypothetical protein